MNRKLYLCALVWLLLVAGVALAATNFAVGQAVYAEWTPNGWYHGKIDVSCATGWHIAFDDGDQKCCTPQQIVLDVVPKPAAVKVGAKVLAQWTNQRFYPGKVSAINGDNYSITFDDGDKGTVKIAQIRLR